MSKIWDALKKAELEREPLLADDDAPPQTRILTAKQRAAVQALFEHTTVAEACAACGVNQRTLQRWLKVPTFIAAYRAVARAHFNDSLAQLQGASRHATEALRRALDDPAAEVRVRAAAAIVDAASRADLAAAINRNGRRKPR
ncbi:MAG: phBC6A51 family helix-turn-helix protein [Candidatus Binatia bacterium]